VYDYGYKNDWRIICVKVIENYLVFGATNGIVFVLDRANDHAIVYKGTIGSTLQPRHRDTVHMASHIAITILSTPDVMINSVCAYRHGDELRLLVCTNDDSGIHGNS
jgi:hypothetical protein